DAVEVAKVFFVLYPQYIEKIVNHAIYTWGDVRVLIALPDNYVPDFGQIIHAIDIVFTKSQKLLLDHLVSIANNIPNFLEKLFTSDADVSVIDKVISRSLDPIKDGELIQNLFKIAIKNDKYYYLGSLIEYFGSFISED